MAYDVVDVAVFPFDAVDVVPEDEEDEPLIVCELLLVPLLFEFVTELYKAISVLGADAISTPLDPPACGGKGRS